MRLRLRHPNGQTPLTLPDDASVSDLSREIVRISGFKDFELKTGYPPQDLDLSILSGSLKLSETGLDLNGQQIIVNATEVAHSGRTALASNAPNNASNREALEKTVRAKTTISPSILADQDTPEVPIPSYDSILLLRVMPDDNSCLFRAFNSAFFGPMDNVHELRSVIAQSIQASPDIYTTVVLEQSPDDYCRWITTEDAWGGAIELDILSKFFDIEIVSIDVKSLRLDKYNEGKRRCILVYSGIHYDVIALAPRSNTSPDLDSKIFDNEDDTILQGAVDLCRLLRRKHYYTDTSNFQLKCQECGKSLEGEKAALQHAKNTGHSKFGEAS